MNKEAENAAKLAALSKKDENTKMKLFSGGLDDMNDSRKLKNHIAYVQKMQKFQVSTERPSDTLAEAAAFTSGKTTPVFQVKLAN